MKETVLLLVTIKLACLHNRGRCSSSVFWPAHIHTLLLTRSWKVECDFAVSHLCDSSAWMITVFCSLRFWNCFDAARVCLWTCLVTDPKHVHKFKLSCDGYLCNVIRQADWSFVTYRWRTSRLRIKLNHIIGLFVFAVSDMASVYQFCKRRWLSRQGTQSRYAKCRPGTTIKVPPFAPLKFACKNFKWKFMFRACSKIQGLIKHLQNRIRTLRNWNVSWLWLSIMILAFTACRRLSHC